jgi:hypothetical protein
MKDCLALFRSSALSASLALTFLVSCGKQEIPPASQTVGSDTLPVAPLSNGNPDDTRFSAPAAAAVAKPELQKLKGKWLRQDDEYVIEIKSVDERGKLEAGYFNPRPIHVAKAEASQEGAVIKLFIELRDVNYPGSTYTLTYDSGSEQLAGIYFQAVEQQRYQVVFVRMP